jgi:hypothetical protein
MKLHTKPRPSNIARASLIAQIVLANPGTAQSITLDANDLTAVFARELEWVDQQLQRTEFLPLKSKELIDWDSRGGPGINQVTWRKVTEVGKAEWIGNVTTELPAVDVVGNEYTRDVRNLGALYRYSVFELKNAAESPTIRLDSERKSAAYNAVMRKHDVTALIGDTTIGWTGLFNDANVPLVTAITGNWSTSATGEQIAADLSKLVWSVYKATLENYEIDTLALPTAFAQVFDKVISNTGISVRKYIQDTFPQIKRIITSVYLDTAGAGSIKRVLAFKKSKDVVLYGANDPFNEEPPQAAGLDFRVPVYGRSSGTQIRKPLAMAYMDLAA